MHVRPGSWPRRLGGAVLVLGLASAPAGCGELDPAGSSGAPQPAAATAGGTPVAGSALAALDGVAVKGRAPRTGYERDRFGDGWVDTDRNGCDTRNDILARDLTGETFRPGTRDCVVLTGTLADPYSGRTIEFRRGEGTSDDVQIDHVVALSDAWQKGAQGWDEAERVRFANDPVNLLAADGPLNMQKGDGDAATWLPPDTSFRCAYVARQVAVKAGYGLWVTQAEHDAMAGVLAGCPDEPLPGPGPDAAGPAPEVATTPGPAAPVYADCAAVRAAGAAPIRRADPGFSPAFDGDGDGVGCES
ncbi:GmrSD restriction endonuclease domain-containing protein [Blastococcus xanthinilyticus]|uniref:Excalibur calcium-binding domain-containing protein n=1 Tax=Blastococcus xanthinilyticus TaxID=1564164 RepID=A0A5S5D2B7_9ACTN|nr:DUF1524 domain-containing protein [Blastococcus xanthinilyticus]TYP89895.1 excalibur calcium-binding domain-containing protein [Blastococcus xanthinilyticus]